MSLHPVLGQPNASDEALLGACSELSRGPVVGRALFDGRVHVRQNAARMLRGWGELTTSDAAMVAVACKDGDPVVRRFCLEALAIGDVDGEVRLPLMLAGINDDNNEVRDAATRLLGQLIKDDRIPLKPLIRQMGEASYATQILVCELVAAGGKHTYKPLVVSLASRSPLTRRWSRATLRKIGGPVVKALLSAVLHDQLAPQALRVLESIEELTEADHAYLKSLRAKADPSSLPALLRAHAAINKALEAARDRPVEVSTPEFWTERLTDASMTHLVKETTLARLLWTLRDGRAHVRANALDLMRLHKPGKTDHAEVTATVAPLAKDEDDGVKLAACALLAACGDSSSVRSLINLTGNSNKRVVNATVTALGSVAERHLDAVLDGLSNRLSPAHLKGVVRAISRVGPSCVPALTLAVEHARRPVARDVAARVLGELETKDDAAIGALIRALDDEAPGVRGRAAVVLGRIGRGQRDVVYALRQLTRRESVPAVRRAAGRAADKALNRAAQAAAPKPVSVDGFMDRALPLSALTKAADVLELSTLMKRLTDGRAVVRRNAALSIGVLRPGGEGPIDALLLRMKDEDPAVVGAAAAALGMMGSAARRAIPKLGVALATAQPLQEGPIAQALGRFGPEGAVAIIEALGARAHVHDDSAKRIADAVPDQLLLDIASTLGKDERLTLKRAAADVLRAAGPRARGAEVALRQALSTPLPRLQVRLVRALAACAAPSAETLAALHDLDARAYRASVCTAVKDALNALTASAQDAPTAQNLRPKKTRKRPSQSASPSA